VQIFAAGSHYLAACGDEPAAGLALASNPEPLLPGLPVDTRMERIIWRIIPLPDSEQAQGLCGWGALGYRRGHRWSKSSMNNDYRILVAIDLKPGTDRLLAEVQRYGQALNASVDIIHVAAPDPAFIGYMKSPDPGVHENQDTMIRETHAKDLVTEHQQTQTFAAELRANGVRVNQALTVQGPTMETILAHVQKQGSNLLMLGSHHHNALYRLWYGDTATEAVKQAKCALLVVPM
jgi:nucleotide-binding universal stress UspA family protein